MKLYQLYKLHEDDVKSWISAEDTHLVAQFFFKASNFTKSSNNIIKIHQICSPNTLPKIMFVVSPFPSTKYLIMSPDYQGSENLHVGTWNPIHRFWYKWMENKSSLKSLGVLFSGDEKMPVHSKMSLRKAATASTALALSAGVAMSFVAPQVGETHEVHVVTCRVWLQGWSLSSWDDLSILKIGSCHPGGVTIASWEGEKGHT